MTATEIFLVIVVIFLVGLVIVLTVLYCKKQNEISDNPQVRIFSHEQGNTKQLHITFPFLSEFKLTTLFTFIQVTILEPAINYLVEEQFDTTLEFSPENHNLLVLESMTYQARR